MVDPKAMRKHWAGLRAFFRGPRRAGERSHGARAERVAVRVGEPSLGCARLTNEKRWWCRDGERVAGPSLTDRSAIAQRQVERVAGVAFRVRVRYRNTPIRGPLAAGAGAGVAQAPQEPSPGRNRGLQRLPPGDRGPGQGRGGGHPAGGRIGPGDPRGRCAAGGAAGRAAAGQRGPDAGDPAARLESLRGRGPSKLKAPQYFFGRPSDQGDNAANWRPFARLVWSAARKPASVPAAGPVLLEPAV